MVQLMGADNPAYRGGVTHLRTLVRNSKMYKEWKELTFQKDRYKCVDCGVVGDRRTLEAHHVVAEFADLLQDFIAKYPQYSLPKDEQRLLMLSQAYAPFWRINNAVSLCHACHKQRHATQKLEAQAKNEATK